MLDISRANVGDQFEALSKGGAAIIRLPTLPLSTV
jgi:hypothetical protein